MYTSPAQTHCPPGDQNQGPVLHISSDGYRTHQNTPSCPRTLISKREQSFPRQCHHQDAYQQCQQIPSACRPQRLRSDQVRCYQLFSLFSLDKHERFLLALSTGARLLLLALIYTLCVTAGCPTGNLVG